MDDFFSRHSSARWPAQERLHVYATPTTPELRHAVNAYQAALQPLAAEHGIKLVPPQWQHFTVQMIRRELPAVPPEQLGDLVDRLGVAALKADLIPLLIGPPQVSRHAIELWVSPGSDDAWGGLVEGVRDAVTGAIDADALPPLGPNATPHTSIAYGVGPGDSGALMSALQKVRIEPVLVTVRRIHLLAVTQHPERGMYTWKPCASMSLGAPQPH